MTKRLEIQSFRQLNYYEKKKMHDIKRNRNRVGFLGSQISLHSPKEMDQIQIKMKLRMQGKMRWNQKHDLSPQSLDLVFSQLCPLSICVVLSLNAPTPLQNLEHCITHGSPTLALIKLGLCAINLPSWRWGVALQCAVCVLLCQLPLFSESF